MTMTHPTTEQRELLEIVAQDCAYGWRASALMSDGSLRHGTSRLYPTEREAIEAVRAAIAKGEKA